MNNRKELELLDDEKIKTLYSAIRKLDEFEESVLSLKYYNMFDTAEISACFHIPINETHRLLASGLEKIKSCVGEGFYEDESELEKLLLSAFDIDVSAELQDMEALYNLEKPQNDSSADFADFKKYRKKPSTRLKWFRRKVLVGFYRIYEKIRYT